MLKRKLKKPQREISLPGALRLAVAITLQARRDVAEGKAHSAEAQHFLDKSEFALQVREMLSRPTPLAVDLSRVLAPGGYKRLKIKEQL